MCLATIRYHHFYNLKKIRALSKTPSGPFQREWVPLFFYGMNLQPRRHNIKAKEYAIVERSECVSAISGIILFIPMSVCKLCGGQEMLGFRLHPNEG